MAEAKRKQGFAKVNRKSWARKGGRLGGKARVPKGVAMLPPEQRVARARAAAMARWHGKDNENNMKKPEEV